MQERANRPDGTTLAAMRLQQTPVTTPRMIDAHGGIKPDAGVAATPSSAAVRTPLPTPYYAILATVDAIRTNTGKGHNTFDFASTEKCCKLSLAREYTRSTVQR